MQEKPSANGTKVNGQDITGQGKIKLENDGVIELAGIIEVTFQSTTKTDEKKTTEREQLEEKYAKNTSPNKLKEAIYAYRCRNRLPDSRGGNSWMICGARFASAEELHEHKQWCKEE